MNAYNHAEFSLTHKRSEVDANERQLIDEAIAAGKVQKIPQGKSAFTEDYVWEGDKNNPHGFGKLVPVNPMTLQERRKKFNKNFTTQRKKCPEIEFRRKEVLRLVNEGYTGPEIAKYLGLNRKTVQGYRADLVKRGLLEKCVPGGTMSQSQLDRRREKVRELVLAGHTNAQIAEALSCGKSAVAADRLSLRQAGKLPTAVGGRL